MSYAIIILLSILVNLIGYGITMRVLNNEIEKNNRSSLMNLRYICDNYFKDVSTGAFSLLSSDMVSRIARSYRDDYDRSQWAGILLSDMRKQNLQRWIGDGVCSILFKDIDLCIQSNLGVSSLSAAYRSSFEEFYESKEAWLNRIFSVSGMEYTIITLPSGQKKVFLIYCVPTIHEKVAVVAEVNNTLLVNLLSSARDSSEKTLITDGAGNTLFASEFGDNITNIQLSNNRFTEIINGEKYISSSVKSEVDPFCYVRLVPSDTYNKEIRRVQASFIIGYIICIFVVGTLAYGFSVMNCLWKQTLDNALQKKREQVQMDALRWLLLGKYKDIDQETLYDHQRNLQSKHFVVLLFEAFPVSIDSDIQNLNENFYQSFYQYFITIFNRNTDYVKPYFCSMDDMCAVIVSTNEHIDLTSLKKNVNDMCLEINEKMDIDVRCSISRQNDDFYKLHEAYEQVLEVSGYRFLRDNETVLVYDEITKEYPQCYYSLDNEQNLIGMLILGQYEDAVGFVERLFDGGSEIMTLNMLKVFMSEIISTLLKASMEIDINNSLNVDMLYKAFMKINSISNLYDVKNTIFEYIRKLCDISMKDRNAVGDSNNKYNKIAEYIDENYANPNIDVNTLAETFNISRSWVVYKKC